MMDRERDLLVADKELYHLVSTYIIFTCCLPRKADVVRADTVVDDPSLSPPTPRAPLAVP